MSTRTLASLARKFGLLGLALLVVALGACVDRGIEPDMTPTPEEEVCDRVCVVYEACWEPHDSNLYTSASECAETCVARHYAWPYDIHERYECADVIFDLQSCLANLSCAEFDFVGADPGDPCSEEFRAYLDNECDGPDPLDQIDTETG